MRISDWSSDVCSSDLEITPEDLDGEHANQWKEAEEEALLLELGPESDRLHEQIKARIKTKEEPWVLVGGPPCQAYSLAGRVKNKKKAGYVPEEDIRHYLYREYLQILSAFAQIGRASGRERVCQDV